MERNLFVLTVISFLFTPSFGGIGRPVFVPSDGLKTQLLGGVTLQNAPTIDESTPFITVRSYGIDWATVNLVNAHREANDFILPTEIPDMNGYYAVYQQPTDSQQMTFKRGPYELELFETDRFFLRYCDQMINFRSQIGLGGFFIARKKHAAVLLGFDDAGVRSTGAQDVDDKILDDRDVFCQPTPAPTPRPTMAPTKRPIWIQAYRPATLISQTMYEIAGFPTGFDPNYDTDVNVCLVQTDKEGPVKMVHYTGKILATCKEPLISRCGGETWDVPKSAYVHIRTRYKSKPNGVIMVIDGFGSSQRDPNKQEWYYQNQEQKDGTKARYCRLNDWFEWHPEESAWKGLSCGGWVYSDKDSGKMWISVDRQGDHLAECVVTQNNPTCSDEKGLWKGRDGDTQEFAEDAISVRFIVPETAREEMMDGKKEMK
eukprot:108207_1